MSTFKDRLTEIMLNQKILTAQKLQEALDIQKKKSIPLREVLLKEGFIDESRLISVLSDSLYIPTLNISNYHIDASLAGLVPERLSRQYRLIPIARLGDTLTVAMTDPLNIFALDDLRIITGFKIDPVIALEKDILRAQSVMYQHKGEEVPILGEEELKDAPSSAIVQSGHTLE